MSVADVPEIVQDFEEYLKEQGYMAISRADEWEKGLIDGLSEERAEEHLAIMSKQLGFSLKGKRLLDIGSGPGLFVAISRIAGIEAFGIEPDVAAWRTASKVMKYHGIDESAVVRGRGEKLPFPDEHFDIVYSASVLEHVMDPKLVLGEAIRVLRRGGFLYIKVPNYGSFWEGHYAIPWVPYLPKALAKMYVTTLRRNPCFIDGLNFMTPGRIAKLLTKHKRSLKVLDLGIALWEERLMNQSAPGWAGAYKLKRVVAIVHKLRLANIIRILGKKLKFYTPMIIIAEKVH